METKLVYKLEDLSVCLRLSVCLSQTVSLYVCLCVCQGELYILWPGASLYNRHTCPTATSTANTRRRLHVLWSADLG